MNTIHSTVGSEFYAVSRGFRWFTLFAVPPILALLAWAAMETIDNRSADAATSQLLGMAFMLVLYVGVAFSLVSAIVWAFRAYIRIDGDCMTVRGAYRKTVLQPESLEGYKIVNGQYHVYVKHRAFAVQIAYFERIWEIEQWISQRSTNIDEEALDEEAADISKDTNLGYHVDDKANHLAFLRKWVNRANYLTYGAIAIGAVNFLFVENRQVEQVSIAVLILVPFVLILFALSHRGHIRIDHDDGTQYPQIFTATFASGIALLLLSLLDRGALLNNQLYGLTAVGVLLAGLIWCFIDMKRLAIQRQRGQVGMWITVVALFLIPAPWVGGSLYQFNKLADESEPVWYETSVVETTKTSGKGRSYSIDLVPWANEIDEPVTVTLRRQEFEHFQTTMPVLVAVKEGALRVPWVAGVRPLEYPKDVPHSHQEAIYVFSLLY